MGTNNSTMAIGFFLTNQVLIELEKNNLWSMEDITKVHCYLSDAFTCCTHPDHMLQVLPRGYQKFLSPYMNKALDEKSFYAGNTLPELNELKSGKHAYGYEVLKQHLLLLTLEG